MLIILTQYIQLIHIIHINHRLIICLLNLFILLNTAFVLSVIPVKNFGILYLLMLRKSSRFPVFVNISRILWLMVIILLLIPNVLRLYYLNYYLINEVILFYLKQLFCIYIPSTHILVWVTYSVSSTNYLGVPNSAQWTYKLKFSFPSQSLDFIF